MLRGIGVPVSFTNAYGETFTGHAAWNESDEEGFRSADTTLTGRESVAMVATASFPGLAAGATLRRTDTGTAYRVVQVRLEDDGAITRVWCARPA